MPPPGGFVSFGGSGSQEGVAETSLEDRVQKIIDEAGKKEITLESLKEKALKEKNISINESRLEN